MDVKKVNQVQWTNLQLNEYGKLAIFHVLHFPAFIASPSFANNNSNQDTPYKCSVKNIIRLNNLQL